MAEKKFNIERITNKIIQGDAIKILKKIPDNSIDLVIADPPYWKAINEKWDYLWRVENDYIVWCREWLTEISRVIKRTGSFYLFGYFRILSYLTSEIEKLGFAFRQQILIDKGMKSVSGRATRNYKMLPNVTESILFFVYNNQPNIKEFLNQQNGQKNLKAKEINDLLECASYGGGLWSLYAGDNILAQIPTEENWLKLQKIFGFDKPYSEVNFVFNPQMGLTNVWSDINFYKEERYHPTQKPLEVINRIIKASSNEGMLVLDPFVGAGSTAISAKNLNRNFIGIEIEKEYCVTARKRLKKEKVEALKLFDQDSSC